MCGIYPLLKEGFIGYLTNIADSLRLRLASFLGTLIEMGDFRVKPRVKCFTSEFKQFYTKKIFTVNVCCFWVNSHTLTRIYTEVEIFFFKF